MITELKANEVFVFGSNGTGFHGAGAAGFACRGDSRNTWRQDTWFQRAMKSLEGSEDRVGKWAVYGVALGFQQGREGQSYAIQTVTRPGAKRSVTRREIYYQLVDLWEVIRNEPSKVFLITPLGEGYAGYTHEEMKEVWDFLILKHGERSNVRFIK